ncbi:MAG: GNAT family protein [Treponema sp.]|nr:GNAT family protein [Treponema sp.]
MKAVKALVGGGVYLSPLGLDDVERVMVFMNDEDVRVLARSRRDALNEATTKDMIERIQKQDEGFMICRNDDDRKIGYALIMDQDRYNREASIALVIGERDQRGKGFGGEALRLLLKHGFVNLNLESMYLGVYEYNTAAIGLYEKTGFKPVGRRRNAKIFGNRKYDEVIMDMISDEYFARYGNAEMDAYGI